MSVGHSPQGLISVSVGGSGGCTWDVSTDEDWLETLESTVSEGGTVSVSVSDNRSVARSGTVSIGNESVIIEQADGCVAGWTTGPLGFYAGGSQNARASGSSACTFDVSDDQDWITVSPSSVKGGGIVTVTAAENIDPWRSGTVTISNGNGSEGLTITQANGCEAGWTTGPLEFGNAAGSQDLTPSGSRNCTFNVSDDRDWITVSPSRVTGGRTVTVSVTKNVDPQRIGSVTISNGNGSASLSVTQADGCEAGWSTGPLGFVKAGGSQNARASGSRNCTFNVSDDRTWIHVDSSSVSGRETVEVTADPNVDPWRTGTVTISNSNGSEGLTITQEDGCSPDGGTTSLTFGSGGGSKDARAGGSSLCTFGVSDDRSWIHVDSSSVSGRGTVEVTVDPNDGPTRMGTVTFSHANGNATVQITQEDGCSPDGGTTSLTFGSGGGSKDARAGGSSLCTFGVSDDRSWIHVDSSSVSGRGTVEVTVDPNDGPTRMGTVTFSHANGNATVRITQEDGCSPDGGTTSLTFGSGGGSKDARAGGSSLCTFGVSDDRSWIHVDSSSVSGRGTVEVTVDPNDGPTRMGTVTFSHANGNATVQITQEDGCSPDGGTTSLTFGSGGGSKDARAGGSSLCTFGVSDDRTWIRVDSSSVSGRGTVEVTVDPNDGPTRMGTVTFSHANGDASVDITQRNGCMPAGGTTSLTFGKAGGSQDATAGGSSACTFGVSADRDWIEVGASSVAGSRSVSVSVGPNNGLERTGTVTFSHANGDASVDITQRNGCTAAGTTTSLTFGNASGAQDATAGGSSACTFGVSADQEWIEVGASSVAGGGTVEVSVEANTGPARSGTVTVGDASVSITQVDGCTAAGTTTSLTFGNASGAQDATAGGSSACTFAVNDDRDWISVGAVSVAGGGTVEVSVEANTGPARSGTVTVGDASVAITQADGCTAAGTTASLTFGKASGAEDATAGGSSACTFAVSDDRDWIEVGAVSVAGGGTVEVSVEANTGPARTGTVTIGDASVAITQADGCAAAGTTASLTFGKASGAEDATAGGSSACTFAVSDDRDWIEVGAVSVAGGGTVEVSVEANTGPARTGTVTIGDASVAITQADGCAAAGTTASLAFGSGTGAQDATLSGSSACTFAVSDDQDWIEVSASSVAGGGTVTVSVTEHTGTVARTGTVTIGLQLVSVTQAGGCQAAPGVTVPLVSFGNGGGALSVGVGESSVCEYAVTADAAWVTVQPALVTGGGTVTVTVPEDLSGGGPRRGAVTIGAAGVRVAQGNTPPVAAADAVTTWRETATPVAVLANDTDADDDPLAVAAVVTAPAQGTAAVSADGQTVTYTSAAGWAGDETFTYQVTDGVGGTAEATVTVTVRAATPFTDPVLTVGVTPIKAVHMTELRQRADAVRVGCGLTAATWTDPVLTAGVTPIKAVHMTELRAAVTAAYAACTQTAPAWTDPVLEAGVTPIKAVHMTELREAVIALE